MVRKQTGLVYDHRMSEHRCLWDSNYPECPERFTRVLERPPGHHAMKSEYCGYCFFNNVAIAATHALTHCGVSRILIVDWDVHHGQATQQMFYDDPRVVYFSLHRYEHGSFWPNLRESDYDFIGEGAGAGYNFNVPLNNVGMTDADYLAVFHQILLPMVTEFGPDLIIVSAGYDSALGDEKVVEKYFVQ
ncbi:Histone deacetylase 10 [Blattella germanica]|nr:Histone deacetylase 10 [Blattella germanica]